MSYRLYHTEGIILTRNFVAENDLALTILTPRLGLIRAYARGMRQEKSKLRFATDLYSRSQLSLVAGQEWWRLISAEATETFFLPQDVKKLLSWRRVASLLGGLVGERPEAELYQELLKLLRLSRNCSGSNRACFNNWELLSVTRILSHLGYLPDDELLNKYTQVTTDNRLLEDLNRDHGLVLPKINTVLRSI